MRTLSYDIVIDPTENVKIVRQYNLVGKAECILHKHEFIELAYCYEGSGFQVIGKREYPMSRGSLLFLNYGQSHKPYSNNGMRYFDFMLMPSFISESLINTVDAFSLLSLTTFSDIKVSDFPPIIQLSGKDMLEAEQISERMYEEFNLKKLGYRAVISGYMTVLFSIVFRKMALPTEYDSVASDRFNAADVIRYIEDHLNEKINLTELAKRSFYNASYFGRLFKEYSGQNLTDFIHKKRMDWAVVLLHTTGKSIEEISQMVGYSDIKRFYRQFKLSNGMTPSAVRKQLKCRNTP